MKSHRLGFTLIETIIGLGILAVVGAVFLMAVRGSSSEIEFSSDHFATTLLTQKVMEDCAQELFLNPLGFDALGISETPETSGIVNGESVFFNNLEDNVSPWGKIEFSSDGGIGEGMPSLYRLAEKYELKIQITRQADINASDYRKNLVLLKTGFIWPTPGGNKELFAISEFSVPFSAKESSHNISYPNNLIEQTGAIVFFDSFSQSFHSLVSNSGAKYDILYRLARIETACNGFLYSPYFTGEHKKLQNMIMQAQNMNFDQPTNATYDHIRKCAVISYEIAKEAYRFIRYLDDDAKTLQGQLTHANLGSYLSQYAGNYCRTLSEYERLFSTFTWSLQTSKFFYEVLCQRSMTDFQDRKRQYFNLLQLINLNRIMLVMPASRSLITKNDYVRFWEHVENYCDGRNPALHRMAIQEINFSANQTDMLLKNLTLAQFAATVANAVSFINSST